MWRTGWLGLGMKATWSGSEKGLDNKKIKKKKTLHTRYASVTLPTFQSRHIAI